MPIRILIADDHAVVRQGLRAFLEVDPELEVVEEAADGHQAVCLAHRLRPDVVVMDLAMPFRPRLDRGTIFSTITPASRGSPTATPSGRSSCYGPCTWRATFRRAGTPGKKHRSGATSPARRWPCTSG